MNEIIFSKNSFKTLFHCQEELSIHGLVGQTVLTFGKCPKIHPCVAYSHNPFVCPWLDRKRSIFSPHFLYSRFTFFELSRGS